ncbi:MAG: histidinol-phosphatase HisJ family protein [Erysipelotrichia bacterium]|nr:histidinol-phosphatase HisJ family protein [Erysipelotrichia bacterium]NCC54686.1 histidinol-phosphatase HisJ family protein [Erysipelotrichia bacterium]
MKTNYHTHTKRCHYASGSDEEYVLSAIKGGYDELGFSDHSCWRYDSDFIPHIRMRYEEFDEYYQSISILKEKYKEQITIKIGLECEYFPKYMDWLKTFIKEKQLDYIILGNHFANSDEDGQYYGSCCDDDTMLTRYVNDAIAGLNTGLYSYLAHPDLFMRGRKQWDTHAIKESYRLCEYCKKNDIILEYNLEGALVNDRFHKIEYPYPAFWQIAAKVKNKVMIGVDAHNNVSLESDYYRNQAIAFLKQLNMEIIDTIPLKF